MFAPPELQPRYEDNPDVKIYNYVYFTPITLAFNFKHPILQDVKVREAIRMAIDKETLTDTVTKGRGIVANNQYADTGPLDRYNDYDDVSAPEFDVEEANRILDEAGYTMGDDDIRVSPDGERFSFNIITYSGFEEYVNDQVILQEMLAEIGIELTPQVVDYSTLESMWADPNDDPSNRALELEEWPHPFEFDPDVYNELHSDNLPPTGLNYMWVDDEEIDRLIDQGRTTTDPDERVEVYKELDRRRNELVVVVPLYDAVDGWVVSNRVEERRRHAVLPALRLVRPEGRLQGILVRDFDGPRTRPVDSILLRAWLRGYFNDCIHRSPVAMDDTDTCSACRSSASRCLLRAPGDPVSAIVASSRDSGSTMTQQDREALREQYGLNNPVYVQYYDWVSLAARGNFGNSTGRTSPSGMSSRLAFPTRSNWRESRSSSRLRLRFHSALFQQSGSTRNSTTS